MKKGQRIARQFALLYKDRAVRNTVPLQKIFKFIKPFPLHLILQSLQLIGTATVLVFLSKLEAGKNSSSFLSFLLVGYALQNTVVLFKSPREILVNYPCDFLRTAWPDDNSFYRWLFTVEYLLYYLHYFPLTLPTAVTIVITDPSLISAVVLIRLSSFLLFFLTKRKKSFFTTTLSILAGRFLLFSLAFLFSKAVVFTASLSRAGLKKFGYTPELDKWFKREIIHSFKSLLARDSLSLWQNFPWHQVLHGAAILVLILAFITYRRYTFSPEKTFFSLPHRYLSWIEKKSHLNLKLPYHYKDYHLFLRKARHLEKNPLGLFFSAEEALLLGSSAAILPHIHNPFLILLLFFFSIFVAVTAAVNNTAFFWSDIFHFTSDLRNKVVHYLAPSLPPGEIFLSKLDLLITASLPPAMTACLPLTILYFVHAKSRSLLLLIDLALILFLFRLIVKDSLQVNYRVFSFLIKDKNTPPPPTVHDFRGYSTVAMTSNIAKGIFFYLFIALLVGGAFFPFFSGLLWLAVYIVFAASLPIILFSTTASLPDRKTLSAQKTRSLESSLPFWRWTVRTYRSYFLTSFAIFTLSLGAGIITSLNREMPITPLSFSTEQILINNLLAGGRMVLMGLISFGLINTILLALNGYLFGYTFAGVYNKYGFAPLVSGVFPHAPFEIAAILLSCTLGYEALRWLKIIRANPDIKKGDLLKSFLLVLALTLVLYTIAAFIEANFAHV